MIPSLNKLVAEEELSNNARTLSQCISKIRVAEAAKIIAANESEDIKSQIFN